MPLYGDFQYVYMDEARDPPPPSLPLRMAIKL